MSTQHSSICTAARRVKASLSQEHLPEWIFDAWGVGSHPFNFVEVEGPDSDLDANAAWFKVSTTNRVALFQGIEGIVKALDGLMVSLTVDKSWRWDHSVRTARGNPTYHIIYVLFFSRREKPWDANSPAAKELQRLGRVCQADYGDLNLDLFDYQREKGVDLFSSYHWTTTGIVVQCETKDKAEQMKLLFPGAKVKIADKKVDDFWAVTVDWPNKIQGLPEHCYIEAA